jgi:hypothetical protein
VRLLFYRERKVQCVFKLEFTAYQRCLDGNTRVRSVGSGGRWELLHGMNNLPQSTMINANILYRRHTNPLSLPIGDPCPGETCLTIIKDYLVMIYRLLPLVYRSSFRALLGANTYTTNPVFFRLCLALYSVVVASVHRKFEIYSGGRYADIRCHDGPGVSHAHSQQAYVSNRLTESAGNERNAG